MPQFLKRREHGEQAKKAMAGFGVEQADSVFAKAYPALSEFLSLEEWEPGVERTRGTMTLFFEDGCFKGSVNDRDGERVAFVTKKGFKTLLEAIEKGLATDSLDWRPSFGKGKGKGRKA